MGLQELVNRYKGYFIVNYENSEVIYTEGYENENGLWCYKVSDLHKMPEAENIDNQNSENENASEENTTAENATTENAADENQSQQEENSQAGGAEVTEGTEAQ